VARSKSKNAGPGSIADTVAHLAVWARHAPRGFAHVEYHTEYARAEADRRLGEILLGEKVPYHHVELPVRVTPSQAGRYLLEELEKIESGVVSITGFATAVVEEDRRDFLAILSVRREVLNDLGLCQIWWLTPDFRDALMHIAPDLDSWFMVRLRIEEEFLPPDGEPHSAESNRLMWPPTYQWWPKYPIGEALRGATNLVERFQRARQVQAPTSELIELAASAANTIVWVGAPKLTRELADQVVNGLTDTCRSALADCLPTVKSLNRLARLLLAQGRSSDAAPLLDRAWAIVQQGKGIDHPDVAPDLYELAGLHLDINRPDRAEPLYRSALASAERTHRLQYPSVAQCLIGLARMLGKTSRLKEAEALCRQAVAIDENRLGSDHPDLAIEVSSMAILLRASGRLAEAEPLFRRVLAIDERCLGSDDPSVAYDLGNLAVLLRTMNRLDEAEALLRRALAIDEQGLGPDHPAVARDLVDLASVLRDTGRLAEAEPLARRALAIDERIYDPSHPSVVRDRDLLASLLRAMNRPDEAEALSGQRSRAGGGPGEPARVT
jgi:tetratricopeptide (TPR) repeat protein